ncbi:hypothetical protein GFY24_25785 [Nocardia sp. SYP-A9097]|uniref:hypothetical protein n=1 Tax=Nocardia sp. SYP-A9097 TaxID=2663237 RepID=UPI00129B1D99|nr:hypothetical protein [Nocardia sp. SYP-A9097]MRH90809.1 hypothetical protein [Nocardia sp. SYP-A9097]
MPRETAAHERRVALTPADVAELRSRNVEVRVQQGAGWYADFTNRAYAAAGATLVAQREQVFADPAATVDCIIANDPELIVCAAGHRGNQAPILLDQHALDALTAGAVIVDPTAKAGGNCIATVPNTTVVLPNGITIAHRSNYPAERPHAASRAYGAATTAQILGLIPLSPGR